MRIPNGTHVMVTDGRKMLLFRNEGDADFPNFLVVAEDQQADRPDRALKSDASGRSARSARPGSSAYGEADFHKLAETRFAIRAVDELNRLAESGALDKIVIAADRRTLGTMRRHYSPALRRALVGEAAKDLVKHPAAEIERLLSRA
jgi:protein required for attachment to host cells